MKIKIETYKKMFSYYLPAPPEQGGILGEKDGIVCDYAHDMSPSDEKRAIYVPNTMFLNDRIKEWSEHDIHFCGLVHSHPAGQESLSSSDKEYLTRLYDVNIWLESLFFPIIINGSKIIIYKAKKADEKIQIRKDTLIVIE